MDSAFLSYWNSNFWIPYLVLSIFNITIIVITYTPMKIRFNNLLLHVKKVDSLSAPSNLLYSLDYPNCTIHKLSWRSLVSNLEPCGS